jgi:hypothetical protein
MIETSACVQVRKWKRLGYEAAKFHIGALELLPSTDIGSSEERHTPPPWWSSGIWTNIPPRPILEYQLLGIAGDKKQYVWDSVKRHHFWRMETEDDKEKERARTQRLQKRAKPWTFHLGLFE